MIKKSLLTSEKNFYKGNLHSHSTFSDGKQTPEELKELYKANGYSFIAITDHEVVYDHSYLDDNEFITITGAEYGIKEDITKSVSKNPDMKVCHLNIYAKSQHNAETVNYCSALDPYSDEKTRKNLISKYGLNKRVYSPESISSLIAELNNAGFFVAYNHPGWSLETCKEYIGYNGLWGIEVYNTACTDMGIFSYDIMAHDNFHRSGKKVFVTCGDDNHSVRNSCGSFVMVNCNLLTYENIICALLNGDFYASHGPLINELYIQDDNIIIKCSDAKRISYTTYGRRSEAINAEKGQYLNQAVFSMKESDVYFRISVTDNQGNRADTQCYYIKDLTGDKRNE